MIPNCTTFIRKFSLIIGTCCLLFGTTTNANAALVGQNVFGVLNFGANALNLFDPANIGLSQGALNEISNPVTISQPGLEFAHTINGVIGVTANFTDTGLFITTDVPTPPAMPWTMSLQSAAFVGLTLSEVSDNFVNGGVDGMLVGDTLTFNWAGRSSSGPFQTAEYSLLATVPLPAALPLFAAALAGFGFFGRRRKRAVTA